MKLNTLIKIISSPLFLLVICTVDAQQLDIAGDGKIRGQLDVTEMLRVQGNIIPTAGGGLEITYDESNHLGCIEVYDRDQDQTGDLILRAQSVGIGTAQPNYQLELSTYNAAKPGGGTWINSTSDRRLKKNIRAYEDGLQEVLKIKPVWYQYEDRYNLPINQDFVGIIAQDMQKIAPYMVGSSLREDSEGVKEYLNFDENALTFMLVNAVKDQQALIESQQSEIDKLKKVLDDHSRKLDSRVSTLERSNE